MGRFINSPCPKCYQTGHNNWPCKLFGVDVVVDVVVVAVAVVSSDFYETLKLLISNTRYMTLGPKFYTKLVSAITRRRMHLNQWFRGESKKVRHSPSSDSVKSRFKALFKKWHPWIRICCFSLIFASGGRLHNEAYNVRTIYKHKS